MNDSISNDSISFVTNCGSGCPHCGASAHYMHKWCEEKNERDDEGNWVPIKNKRKVVQIATWNGVSTALADDGTIWQTKYTCGDHPKLEWFRFPDVPQDEVKNETN